MKQDLHALPKLRDSISYVYLEHAIVEQEDSSIVSIQSDGCTAIPVMSHAWAGNKGDACSNQNSCRKWLYDRMVW